MNKNSLNNSAYFNNIKWFAIIEVLIWIFIFTLGLISIYLLISSSLDLNRLSKNQIIATNLSKEWLELIRNIRDSNYLNNHNWNQLNPDEWSNSTPDFTRVFEPINYYTIENNFSNSLPLIYINRINDFWEWKSELNWKMLSYKLCLDSENRYTYDCSLGNKWTFFYRYIKVDNVQDSSWIKSDAIRVISKVIWTDGWYHDLEIETILTDWKRL